MNGMIVAVNPDWVIGRTNGEIPWRHKGDQKLFKETTEDGVVIMGRKTWEGIPKKFRPLPNRVNIVVSNSYLKKTAEEIDQLGVDVLCTTPEDALTCAAKEYPHKDVWIMGGASIYSSLITYCDEIHITHVPDIVEGDDLVCLPENCRLTEKWASALREGDENLPDMLRHGRYVMTQMVHPYNDKLTLRTFRVIEHGEQ